MDQRARRWSLIAIRLVVSTVLLGWAMFIEASRPEDVPVRALFLLVGLTYALSIAFIITLRSVDRRPWLVDAQFAGDALIVTGFIGVSGGVASFFSSLYLVPIIAASTIRFRRGAVQVAFFSALLYTGLAVAQYVDVGPLSGLLRPYAPVLPTQTFAFYTVAINLFGFLAVALLSGSLAERLRRADARLERASHEIADLTAYNEHVIDSLHSGLATTDRNGRVLTFNRAAGLITALAPGPVIGRDIAEVLHLPGAFRASLTGLTDGRSVRHDTAYRRPDGVTVDIGLTVTPLRFPDDARGFLFTFQDVTDVKQLESQMRMRQRLAALGEMAAGIAHEIRNPLASMSGSIQMLRQSLHLSDEQAQLMDIVLRESDRLNDTIRSFLAYARPQHFDVSRLDLRVVVQEAAALLRNSADVRTDHAIEVDVPGDPVWFQADGAQMRQIVWNLATNGLKAMSGGGRLRLAVGTGTAANGTREVRLTVEDTGRGMPAAEVEGMFQPFSSRFEGGTGLGLAIVHRIVTDYNGTVRVRSAVGQGTTIDVHFPDTAARTDAPAPRMPTEMRA
jgi:two-component system sensor histidine kinase PilS (NtrC family)